MQPSPYTPGEAARHLPGRDSQLAEFDERLMYLTEVRRLVGRIRVDIGPRGQGKTSLLREVQRRAEARGVVTLWVTASPRSTLTRDVAEEIRETASHWTARATTRLSGLLERTNVSLGIPGFAKVETSFTAERPGSDAHLSTREFQRLLLETTRAAVDDDHGGLVLFVDEIRPRTPTVCTRWRPRGNTCRASIPMSRWPRSPPACPPHRKSSPAPSPSANGSPTTTSTGWTQTPSWSR